jgi:hypothetical protein
MARRLDSGAVTANFAKKGHEHHICISLTAEMVVMIEKASVFKTDLEAARNAYNLALNTPSQAQIDARSAMDCCKTDLLEFEAKLRRQTAAKSRQQEMQLACLSKALKRAKRLLEDCQAQVELFAVKVRDKETQLLDVLMDLHRSLLADQTRSQATAAVEVTGETSTSFGGGDGFREP